MSLLLLFSVLCEGGADVFEVWEILIGQIGLAYVYIDGSDWFVEKINTITLVPTRRILRQSRQEDIFFEPNHVLSNH